MTAVLGVELLRPLDRLIEHLSEYDPVTQQKLLELMVVRHAMLMGPTRGKRRFVLDSFHKHTVQIMTGWDWPGKGTQR